ncbi:MAG TPA: EAL domain-containing protein [Kamptonema sp.]|nr:EAL domain-containing protein [Kamptonema sp.]
MNENKSCFYSAEILIVDDSPVNLRLLSSLLIQRGYNVRKAINGQAALRAAEAVLPDLILLDVLMPEMNGYEVCQSLKDNPKTANIPVIFLSFLGENLERSKGFKFGACDYINKPFNLDEILIKIQNQLNLKAAREEIMQLNTQLRGTAKECQIQLEAANAKLQANLRDRLTGLPNRVSFIDALEAALNRSKIESDHRFFVLSIDCDRFKIINNSLGYRVGDELLTAIARRLEKELSSSDIFARLGDDEFAILLTDIPDINSAAKVASKILKQLTFPFYLQKYEVFVSASIGIAAGSDKYIQPEHILRDADTALCRAKEQGKARYQIFDRTMREKACQFLQLETDLRKALVQKEFSVHYQPIIELSTGKIAGVEALLRWHHPVRGLVYPAEFIPVAEATGLIANIGSWVLREACRQLRLWQITGIAGESFSVSVNFSAHQFSQPDLIDQIDEILAETQLNPQCLKLEITETAIIENPESAAILLQQLRARKIQLSLDDFGMGYSSLSYLNSFPVDTLKVDKSFVQRLDGNSENLGLVPAIMCIAKTMGMRVIAEGIETAQQLDQLRNLDCDFSQGYLFSRPLDAQKLIELITSAPHW